MHKVLLVKIILGDIWTKMLEDCHFISCSLKDRISWVLDRLDFWWENFTLSVPMRTYIFLLPCTEVSESVFTFSNV